MSDNWDYDRRVEYIRRLRETVEKYGEPLAANIALDELDPANLVLAGSNGVVITEDEHLIFVKRTDLPDQSGLLLTPGGETEPHEAPDETFAREAREETGFDIEVDTLAILYASGADNASDWAANEIALSVMFIGYARGGRLNDCVDRENDIADAVAIRCDEIDLDQLWAVTDKLLVHFTACGPPEISRAELLDQFAQLGRRWPPRLDE